MLNRSMSIRHPSATRRPTHFSALQIEKPRSLLPRLKYYYDKFHLSRYTPFVLLLLYSFLGAYLFHVVEYEHEQGLIKQERHKLQSIRNNTLTNLREMMGNLHLRESTRLQASRDILTKFEEQIFENKMKETLRWDFWGSLFYVGTVYTTIGYGNITPRTPGGRALSIVYALFGIPLVFAILSQFGKTLTACVSKGWIKYREWVRRIRKDKQRRESKASKTRRWSYASRDQIIIQLDKVEESQTTGNVDELDREENESRTIPISLALLLCLGYICACAGLFCIWETKWSYFTSLYFIFISLSTIGLGDVIPDHPHMLILMFWLVIIGLSIVSMLLSVIQIKLEEWLYYLLIKMQKKYQQAVENGEIVESDQILESLLENEPWFMKNLASHLITEKQAAEVEKQASRYLCPCTSHIQAEVYERAIKEVNNIATQTRETLLESIPVSPEAQRSATMFTAPDTFNQNATIDAQRAFETASENVIGRRQSKDADSEFDVPSLPLDSRNSDLENARDMIRVGVEELALLGREYPLFEDQRTRVEPVPGVSVECQVSMDLEDVVARETRDEETSTPHPQILDNSTGISIEMRDKAQETSRSLIDLQDKQTSYEHSVNTMTSSDELPVEVNEKRKRFSESRLVGNQHDTNRLNKSAQYSVEDPKIMESKAVQCVSSITESSCQYSREESKLTSTEFGDVGNEPTADDPRESTYKTKVTKSSSTTSLNSSGHDTKPTREKLDIVLQTEDSYLRVARRLDEYRTIKTQNSLQVYAASAIGKQQHLVKQSQSAIEPKTHYLLLESPKQYQWNRRRSSKNKNRRVSFQTNPVEDSRECDEEEEKNTEENKMVDINEEVPQDLKADNSPEIRVDSPPRDSPARLTKEEVQSRRVPKKSKSKPALSLTDTEKKTSLTSSPSTSSPLVEHSDLNEGSSEACVKIPFDGSDRGALRKASAPAKSGVSTPASTRITTTESSPNQVQLASSQLSASIDRKTSLPANMPSRSKVVRGHLNQ